MIKLAAKKTREFISSVSLAAITSACIIFSVFFTLQFQYGFLKTLAFILVTLAAAAIICASKTALLSSLFVTVAGSILTLIIFTLTGNSKALFLEINNFYYWITDYLYGAAPYSEKYGTLFSMLIAFGIVLYIYYFTVKKKNFLFITGGGMLFYILQWSYDYIVNMKAFYVFIVCLLIYYARHIYFKKMSKENHEYTDAFSFIIWSLPMAVIALLITISIPYGSEPIKWNWMDNNINKIYNFINNIGYNKTSFEFYSLNATGFGSRRGTLGGKVRLDDTHVLTVESESKYYLKGASYDYYDGVKWSGANVLKEEDPVINYINLLMGSDYNTSGIFEFLIGPSILLMENNSLYDSSFFKSIAEEKNLNIIFENLKTKSLFMPAITLGYEAGENINYEIYHGNTVASRNFLGRGFNYSVKSLDINYDSPGFRDIARLSRKGVFEYHAEKYEASLHQGADSKEKSNIEKAAAILTALSEHSNNIHAHYVKLPEGLPQRIGDLSLDITKNHTTVFDKVKAVEAFLSSSYEYTLEPEKTPSNRDFVDYFLFTQREGYCTYYATAMAVMLRTLGIPARYVEGYMMPSETIDENVYHVTNNQAHAWTEVYFEGLGWIPFEPTAPFIASFYTPSASASSGYGADYYNPYMDDYMNMLDEYEKYAGNLDISDYNAGTEKNDGIYILILVIMPLIMAASLGLILLINFIRRKLRIKNFRCSAPKQSIENMFRYYMELLSKQNYKIEEGETLIEFSRRIDKYIIFAGSTEKPYESRLNISGVKNVSTLLRIFNIFIECLYSHHDITDEKKQFVFKHIYSMQNMARRNLGKIRYFIMHNIRGI